MVSPHKKDLPCQNQPKSFIRFLTHHVLRVIPLRRYSTWPQFVKILYLIYLWVKFQCIFTPDFDHFTSSLNYVRGVIAFCGMNDTCGDFIRMCAIFLLHSPTNHRFFWVHHLLTFSLFAIYGPTEALLNSLSHLKCQGGGAWPPWVGAAFEWHYSAILPDCPLSCDGRVFTSPPFPGQKAGQEVGGVP